VDPRLRLSQGRVARPLDHGAARDDAAHEQGELGADTEHAVNGACQDCQDVSCQDLSGPELGPMALYGACLRCQIWLLTCTN
jgi:hypothetical protein